MYNKNKKREIATKQADVWYAACVIAAWICASGSPDAWCGVAVNALPRRTRNLLCRPSPLLSCGLQCVVKQRGVVLALAPNRYVVNSARHRFQGLETAAAPFGPRGARLQSRTTAPGTDFRAWKQPPRLLGRLAHACKAAQQRQTPISGLGNSRRAFWAAWRTLAKAHNSARHRFQGLETAAAPFGPLGARLQSRTTAPGTDFRAWKQPPRLLGRLAHACKAAQQRQAPISGLGNSRRAFWAAWRTLAKAHNSARHRFQGLETAAAPFGPRGARLQSRTTAPGTDFRAWKQPPRLLGRLAHACKAAQQRQTPISGLGNSRRAFWAAWRTLAKAHNSARHRFQGLETAAAPFGPLGARLQSRTTAPGTDFRAWKQPPRLLGRLAHACKAAQQRQAPISGLGNSRRAFWAAWRTLAKAHNSARHRFQGLETAAAPFGPLGACLQSRTTAPGTDFRAWKQPPRLLGRVAHACQGAQQRQAPISGLGNSRRAFWAAWRTLAKPHNSARHRFQGLETAAAPFGPRGARLPRRTTAPGTDFRAWKQPPRLLGRLAHACQGAQQRQAPISGLGNSRRAFWAAWRTLAQAHNSARHRFQGLETAAAPFGPRGARLPRRTTAPGTDFRAWKQPPRLLGRLAHACQSRTTAPGTDFRAWKQPPRLLGRVAHACQGAQQRQAPISGLGNSRRAFWAAWRTLAKPHNSARHRFQGLETAAAPFGPLGACLQSRTTAPGTDFRAWKQPPRLLGRVAHACQGAQQRQAPISGLGNSRRAFWAAWRTLAKAHNSARHRFQGLETAAAPFGPRGARLQSRTTAPGTDFRAWKQPPRLLGRLAHACQGAQQRQAPISGLGNSRRAFGPQVGAGRPWYGRVSYLSFVGVGVWRVVVRGGWMLGVWDWWWRTAGSSVICSPGSVCGCWPVGQRDAMQSCEGEGEGEGEGESSLSFLSFCTGGHSRKIEKLGATSAVVPTGRGLLCLVRTSRTPSWCIRRIRSRGLKME